MKRILFVVALVALCGTGCMMSGDRAHCGYGVYWHKPSSVDTNVPYIVNQGMATNTAHPIGSVAGPVSDGTWNHAAMPPMGMAPMKGASRADADCTPCQPGIEKLRLTIDEYKKICDEANRQKMPGANH